MIALLRSAFGKIAAIALLGGILYAVAALVIGPVMTHYADLEDGIATQRTLLGRLMEAASAAEAAQPGNKAGPGSASTYLDGESDAIRLAGLQSKLSETAQGIGARLSSTQVVPSRVQNGVRLAGVQTQFSASLADLQKFLFELETSSPKLFVETLSVSRGPDRSSGEVRDLDVRLVILGATPPDAAAQPDAVDTGATQPGIANP